MSTLLVLGAMEMCSAAFRTLAELGVDVFLLDGNDQGPYDTLVTRAQRGETWGDVDLASPIGDWLAVVDGVTTLSDFSVVTAARAACSRRLPGPGIEAARRTRNKIKQRRAFAAAGLLGPRYAAVDGEDDLARFFSNGPELCVLKPADSAGSAGVQLVGSLPEALAALPSTRKWSFSGSCIVEQRLSGPEYSVEGWVRDGHVTVAAITAKDVTPATFVEWGHTVPADADCVIGEVAVRAVAALGIETSIFHAEVMDTHDGPVMIEVAARPGGAMIPTLVRAATGIDLYAVQAALALGSEIPSPGRRHSRYAAIRFAVSGGYIRHTADLAPLLTIDGVFAAEQILPAGSRQEGPVGNDLRAGYVIGASDNRIELETHLNAAALELATRLGCR